MRGDLAADDDAAARTTGLDLVDAQANHPVVDQHLMARPEHPADRSRGDRQLAVAGDAVSEHDRDLIALQQVERLVEAADAELRALQVADQRERAADVLLDVAHELGPRGVVLVRAVGEVEARRVHPRIDERAQRFRRRAGGADRRNDLRPARRDGWHAPQGSAGPCQRSARGNACHPG